MITRIDAVDGMLDACTDIEVLEFLQRKFHFIVEVPKNKQIYRLTVESISSVKNHRDVIVKLS